MDPLAFSIACAEEAGEILMERFGAQRAVAEKEHRNDLVTDADRASEASIVAAIRGAFPDAAILGEEGGGYAGSASERFIVDPLDGTTNYAHRYPLFCVSIAYERDGIVECGVVHAPFLGLTFSAKRGGGAHRNGEPIEVSRVDAVMHALICTGFAPWNYDRNGASFAAVARAAQGVRRDGAAALDLAFVASGIFDAFWEYDLHPWDVAAGALLVREAGGTVCAADGTQWRLDGDSIVAGNGRIEGDLVALLRAARQSEAR